MKTPEEEMVNATTWVLEFWLDYKEWMTKDELVEKYRGQIDYDDLIERFVNLFLENRKLNDKIENVRMELTY